ncbi:MAG: hypothetical protein LBQ66_15505 [Planctomycetaceae bacterium]|nr:hypothetical protein [Planctomycetaceae bacterium]
MNLTPSLYHTSFVIDEGLTPDKMGRETHWQRKVGNRPAVGYPPYVGGAYWRSSCRLSPTQPHGSRLPTLRL